jgi:hypothetical protein
MMKIVLVARPMSQSLPASRIYNRMAVSVVDRPTPSIKSLLETVTHTTTHAAAGGGAARPIYYYIEQYGIVRILTLSVTHSPKEDPHSQSTIVAGPDRTGQRATFGSAGRIIQLFDKPWPPPIHTTTAHVEATVDEVMRYDTMPR